jgi:hypothetical protein
MQVFKTEAQAFKAGGDQTAQLNRIDLFPNCGFRVIKCEGGFKVLMCPDRRWSVGALPFYL